MSRKILHLDLDAFFCAVEELRNPALQGKPFAVGGQPHERGVVASCSYAARRCGVRSAMPMARALRLCPELIIVSSRHGLYGDVSESVMERVRNLTPFVEQVSIDEAFMDVSELTEEAETIAQRLQITIRSDLNLPCSLGVASNKLVAKIANDVGKIAAVKNVGHSGPPNAITVVPPGQEADFLAPLPVEMLWGVGPKTAARLAELNILTIGDLARWPDDELVRRFGKNGHDLARHASGIDDSPLVLTHEVKSISQETTFAVDIRDEKMLTNTLSELSERVGKRLRRAGLCGTTVKQKIRWSDFTTLTRQVSFETPIDQDKQIYQAGLSLFKKVWKRGQSVRLIGVGVSGLSPLIRQLTFWDEERDPVAAAGTEKERRLQTAIDQLRKQFGDGILFRGRKGP